MGHRIVWTILTGSLALLALIVPPRALSAQERSHAITPRATIELFDGRSLANFDTWLVGTQRRLGGPPRHARLAGRRKPRPGVDPARSRGRRQHSHLLRQRHARQRRLGVIGDRWEDNASGGGGGDLLQTHRPRTAAVGCSDRRPLPAADSSPARTFFSLYSLEISRS